MRRALRSILLLVAFAQNAAAWIVEPSNPVETSPDGSFVVATGDFGFAVHDSASLQPSFVVARPDAAPRLFSPDGRRLYFTETRSGLFALDLGSGDIEAVAEIPFISSVLLSDDGREVVVLSGFPDLANAERLRVHRLGRPAGAPRLVAELSPIALPWTQLELVLPAKEPNSVLLVARDADAPANHWDFRSWGDFQFVRLDLAEDRATRLSTLAAPREDFRIEPDARWVLPEMKFLEQTSYPNYAYTLIDPSAGAVARELEVPGVEFHLLEPGQVIAYREANENGAAQLYRDYLASGSLKTLRNQPIPDREAWPEREGVAIPEGHRLLARSGARAVTISGEGWGDAYRLHRVDTTTGELAETYDSAMRAPYRFANFAFHPSKPEFFAFDSEENVHFFRVALSGLKRQLRGQQAYQGAYTPDGESVLYHRLVDPPAEQAPAAAFPASEALVYDAPPPATTDPIHVLPPTLSPSGQWLVTVNDRGSSLHRFGEAPIVAALGWHAGERLPMYSFSPDESQVGRLVWSVAWDDFGEESAIASAEFFDIPASSEFADPAAALPLPHAEFSLLDVPAPNEMRALDLRSGELISLNAATGELSAAAVEGLEPEALDELFGDAPPTIWDAERRRFAIGWGDTLVVLSGLSESPRAAVLETPSRIRALHRYGDQRHLVAELETGRLLFVEIGAEQPRLALQLDFLNAEGDYLAQTPAGRFDASPAAREGGQLLRGTRPVALASLFDQAYQPDLFAMALGERAAAAEAEIAEFVSPPVATLGETWINAMRRRLHVAAERRQYPIAEALLYQNDKLVQSFSGQLRDALVEQVEVDLLLEENRFVLVVVDTAGVSARTPELVVQPPEALLREKLAQRRKPELHLLAVGVNEYRNPEYNLNFAVADARGAVAKLRSANQSLFDKINVHELSDGQATRDGILAAFAAVRAAAQPHDSFLFYFAGHGVMSAADGQFYLVPHDVTRIYGESQSLVANGISAFQLRELSAAIAAQKQVFILDACNSGGALQAFAQRGASQEKALAQLARATGTHWIAASSASQFATEFADLGHGAFTHTMLQALDGAADTGDRRITINELKAYLESELPAVTQKHKGAPQYPTSYGYGQDFPIALLP